MVFNYWIEETDRVWIKVPTIPADNKVVLKIEKTGSETPSGDDTFEFFDDFSGSSLDTNKWKISSGGDGNIRVDSDNLELETSGTNYPTHQAVQSKSDFTPNDFTNYSMIGRHSIDWYGNFESGAGFGFITDGYVLDDVAYHAMSSYSDGSSKYHNRLIVTKDESTDDDNKNLMSNGWWRYEILADDTTDIFKMFVLEESTSEETEFSVANPFSDWTFGGKDMRMTVRANMNPHIDYWDYVFLAHHNRDLLTVNVIELSTCYIVEVDNTGGDELTDYQISADASGLGGVSNDESLEIEEKESLEISSIYVNNKTNNSVTLNADIITSESTDVFFQYKKVSDSTWIDTAVQTISSSGVVSEDLEDLDELDNYEFRVDVNSGDLVSDIVSFYPADLTREVEVDSEWNDYAEMDGLEVVDGKLRLIHSISLEDSESFESGFGNWSNVSGNDEDWRRKSGGTGSSSTGPGSAYDGSYYIYVETSSGHAYSSGDISIVEYDVGSNSDGYVDFYYHQYGNDQGTLSLEGYDGSSWNEIWSSTGNQGDQWNHVEESSTTFSGYSKLRFKNIADGSYRGDVALDLIKVYLETSDGSGYRISNALDLSTLGFFKDSLIVWDGTTGDDDVVEAFTTTGSHSWTVPDGVEEVDVLVVAGGGGGGGSPHGGGGGAGGLIFKNGYNVTSGSIIDINVGEGGEGYQGEFSSPWPSPGTNKGDNGQDSIFDELTAIGGGGGGGYSGGGSDDTPGQDGGSGGGGSDESAAGTGLQPNSTDGGYGSDGGTSTDNDYSKGGGGAGERGCVDGLGYGGDGVNEVTINNTVYNFSNIFGTDYGEIVSGEAWFAGGGGGAFFSNNDSVSNTGGRGGGGNSGSEDVSPYNPGDGLSNTGGGGGGAERSNNGDAKGGDGGSGIVLIKYKQPADNIKVYTQIKDSDTAPSREDSNWVEVTNNQSIPDVVEGESTTGKYYFTKIEMDEDGFQ